MSTKTPICPKCQKRMVVRKGAGGDFFGCSGFPSCKYTTTKRYLGGARKDIMGVVVVGNFNTRKG